MWVNIGLVTGKGFWLFIDADGLFTKGTFLSRQWLVLYFSVGGTVAFTTCLGHLRSSAPSNTRYKRRMAYRGATGYQTMNSGAIGEASVATCLILIYIYIYIYIFC